MFSDFSATFLLSTAGLKIFQQLFCLQPPVFTFFSNFFAFNRWFNDSLATFLFSNVFRFFSNFFDFNHWFKDFSATFLLSTTGFSATFCLQPFSDISAFFLLATAGFQIFQQLFYSIWKQKSCWNIFKSAVES